MSGEGVGFSDIFNAPKGLNVIQSDGDLHRRMRSVVIRPLTPAALREQRAALRSIVAERLATLSNGAKFDAMSELAALLPVEVISRLVGLPEEGRDRMLSWAAAAFNVIKPDYRADDVTTLMEAGSFMAALDESRVVPGSWAAGLFEAVRSERLSAAEARAAITAYVFPSIDTTILASGHLLYNLATHKEQWAMLRARPELVPAAVLESVRHSSVVRWFSRVAAVDYPVEGWIIPRDSRVMLLYGCANRDERHYGDPASFNIERDSRDHLAWGTGIHMCAGMHLARMEMEVLLEALIEADVSMEAGDPTYTINAGLFGFATLPLSLQ